MSKFENLMGEIESELENCLEAIESGDLSMLRRGGARISSYAIDAYKLRKSEPECEEEGHCGDGGDLAACM